MVFENGTLHAGVRRAVHAVALDETRIPFTPTLINKDTEDPHAEDPDTHKRRILEAWFPGVHSDIGGGYWLDGLSDLALAFMIKQSKKALGEGISIADGDPAAVTRLLDAQGEALAGLAADDVAIHPMADGPLHAHSGLMVSAGGEEPRRVRVNDNDVKSKDADDLPIVHHSVRQRFQEVADYRPAALRGLKFRLLLPNGTLIDAIHGISGLRAS